MKRRTFVGAAASLPAVGILSGTARAQSKEIRMIELGGASGELIEKGYIEPLFKKTGIKVVRESPELARQAARAGRERPDHHDAVRAGLGRSRSR